MKIPPFEEFAKLESNQSFEQISDIIAKHIDSSCDLSNEEELHLFIAQILGASRVIAVDSLSRYHAWLSQYLEQAYPD